MATTAAASARPSSAGVTLDLRLTAENPDLVKAHLAARGASEDMVGTVDRIGALYAERTKLQLQGNDARAVRKKLSAEIGKMMKAGQPEQAEDLKKQVEAANQEADGADAELDKIDLECNDLFARLPNLLHDGTPDGADEEDNEVVHEWGTDQRKIGEDFLWHDEIADKLSGWDVDGAIGLSGARFSVLKGPLARLERALTAYFLDKHAANGYEEHSVPYIVGGSVLHGTGQLPKFEDDLFKVNHLVNGEEGYLIPTAEVPLTNLHRGQILDKAVLPLRMTALTPCFRAEAGAAGRDTRGLMRQHQFHKVEMVKVTTPETSDEEHEALTRHAEELLEELGLPYRRVKLCGGDIGFSAKICFDLEVWCPGQQAYREISSCSNCGDFQARRMGLRFRGPKEPGMKKNPVVHCHTINGSGLAVGRALLAVLETYQEPDGSVNVPEVLRPYMGGLEKLEPEP